MTDVENILTLAIETSCDETSVAIVKGRDVLAVGTQTHLEHKDFGGIVPEIASRRHIELLDVLVKKLINTINLDLKDIDAVAVTNGPGLIGSLLVGVSYAKGLAQGLRKPLVGINHIYGHIQAAFIENEIVVPYIALVVSGGHTILVYTEDNIHFEVLGQTRDDAAGEAFDKAAKLLNLGFPGGPIIDKVSQNIEAPYEFPIGLKKEGNLDFSFSGLKTSLLYFIKDKELSDKNEVYKIAASFQKAVIEALLYKLENAVKIKKVKNILVVGGVSANSLLRREIYKRFPNYNIIIPPLKYCTDNAAMIAFSANVLHPLWSVNWNKDYTLEAYANLDLNTIYM